MELAITALLVLLVGRFFVYNYLEISPLKYGVLKAMASQSREVNQALKRRLNDNSDLKILNKEYRNFERIYLASLNVFLLQFKASDNVSLRKEILETEQLQF